MKITLNGQTKKLTDAPNLNTIVERFCKKQNPVIAELNGKIIKTPQWESTVLKDGDTLELVRFVGGGKL